MKQAVLQITNRAKRVFREHPLLCGVLLLQIGSIVYVNMFLLICSIGDDASMAYLEAMEMARQGSLLPDTYGMTTSLLWDTPVPIAAVLYKLTHNIFLAYGLANILCTGFFLAVVYVAMDTLGMSIRGKLLAYILLLTPYVIYPDEVNPIRYFHMLFFSLNVYPIKISAMLLIWIVFSRMDTVPREKKVGAIGVLTFLLCLLCGVSSGVYVLIFGLAPAFMYFFFRRIKENDWKNSVGLFVYMAACAAVMVCGKIFCQFFLGFAARDSIAVWTSLFTFWDNLGSIFIGYLELTGAIPWSGFSILSKEGIAFLFQFCLSIFLLYGGVCVLVFLIRRKDRGSIFSWAIVGNLLVLALCYTRYGAPTFEVRYLVPAFVVLVLFAAKWLDGVLQGDNTSLRLCLSGGVAVCVLVVNVVSYRNLKVSENPRAVMAEIKEVVGQYPTPVVYVAGGDSLHLGQIMRIYDESKVYKVSLDMATSMVGGDYSYYNENAEWEGPTLLLSSESTFQTLPAYLSSKYTLVHEIPGSTARLYYSEENPIDYAVGVTDHEKNIDYPYTYGMAISGNGTIDETGALVTDGLAGTSMYGPYCQVPSGRYNYTLNYEVVSVPEGAEYAGFFDVKVGPYPIETVELPVEETSVTISDLSLDELENKEYLEYRAMAYDGAVIRIKSVVIECVS